MLVKREQFSRPSENCQRNVMHLAGSLVTSSRPLGRLQKRHDDRTSNAAVAVRTADGSRRTADAGDEQCLTYGCSSPSCTVVLCAADINRPLHTACTCIGWGMSSQCSSSCMQEMGESTVVLLRVADNASSSIQYSLELVCGGLGCPSRHGVAVVHTWRHRRVDQHSCWLSIKWTRHMSQKFYLVARKAMLGLFGGKAAAALQSMYVRSVFHNDVLVHSVDKPPEFFLNGRRWHQLNSTTTSNSRCMYQWHMKLSLTLT